MASNTSSTLRNVESEVIREMRYLRKDVGVALIVALCLVAGFLLFRSVDTRSILFKATDTPFSISYPAGWVASESLLEQPMMKMEDPTSASAYKSTLTVDMRELDTSAPPTLQTLLDQRVEQRGTLIGYHFLANKETTVGGERAMQYDYAYVAQPIDQPRRASVPVVVIAREYIVVTKDRAYYISLTVPEVDQVRMGAKFDQIINSVKLQ